MKKEDFYDLAKQLEKECGDWEQSEGLSEAAREQLMKKIEQLDRRAAKEDTQTVKHFPMKKRYLLVLAAALVLLMGMSVVSDRAWISDSNDMERASEITTKVNNEEKDSILREEEEIFQEISEKLGIAPIWFGYIPDGMELDSYAVTENTGWAYVNYVYEGNIITVQMSKDQGELSGNVQWDGVYRKLDDIPNQYGYDIRAYCIDETNKNYGAEILYGNGYYNIFGHFSDEEEFFSVLEYIFFKKV